MTIALVFKNTTSDYSGTGAGLGGRLTSAQADNNSWLIKQAIETLQAATGKTISGCTATGNQLTITYTDATTDVVTLPTAMPTWRDEWASGTSYAVFDWFWESTTSAVYAVLVAHEAATSFDAGEIIGGESIYQKIIDLPNAFATPATITSTTYTLLIADVGTFNACTNASGCVVTIPLDSETEFELGSEFHFCQDSSTGAISFDYATGLDLKYPTDRNPVTDIEGAVVTIKKTAVDTWRLFGKLQAATV